jgi:hypothetical protein
MCLCGNISLNQFAATKTDLPPMWLMTNFLSAEFIRRKFGGHIFAVPKIFGSAGALPSKTIRQSLLAFNGWARQIALTQGSDGFNYQGYVCLVVCS